MYIGKNELGHNCFEFYATNGKTAWIAIFTSNGIDVKPITYYKETPGESEWAIGPFHTEAEAWKAADAIQRC